MIGKAFLRINKIRKKETAIYLVTTVLMLQTLRNISTYIYAFILGLSYIILFLSVGVTKSFALKKHALLFLMMYLFLPIYSLVMMPINDCIVAMTRFGAVMPFIVFGFLNKDLVARYRKGMLTIYTIVVVFSAILLIYQTFFGQISLFIDEDDAGRLGYTRYNSLLGSSPTYGAIASIAVIILHDFKPFSKKISLIAEGLILIGGFISLGKAFYVNCALSYALLFLFRYKKPKLTSDRMIKTIILFLIILLSFYIIISRTAVGDYFTKMLNYSLGSGETGVAADLLYRLTGLPQRAFSYSKQPLFVKILFGVGFQGYAGALGISSYPMCHNNYAEIVLSGGIITLLSLLATYISPFVKSLKKKNSSNMFVVHIVPYILINMFVGQFQYLSTFGALMLIVIHSYETKLNEDEIHPLLYLESSSS